MVESLPPGGSDGSDGASGGTGDNSSGGSVATAAPPAPPVAPSAPVANPDELCTKAGYVRDPVDCASFYYCLPNNGGFAALKQTCSAGLVFDDVAVVCNYPELVTC